MNQIVRNEHYWKTDLKATFHIILLKDSVINDNINYKSSQFEIRLTFKNHFLICAEDIPVSFDMKAPHEYSEF